VRLYAIRDRLIGYYMTPFIGASDNQVKHSLAAMINTPTEGQNAISQAPHHFELWKLAEINEETGTVKPDPEFLADCASLVRGGHGEAPKPREGKAPNAPSHRPPAPGGARSPTNSENGTPED